jgi:hypothetical protein
MGGGAALSNIGFNEPNYIKEQGPLTNEIWRGLEPQGRQGRLEGLADHQSGLFAGPTDYEDAKLED